MISVEQHKKFALILKEIFNEVHKDYNEYIMLHTKTSARKREEVKIMDSLLKLKSSLDDKVLRDYPEIETSELISIYYGHKL